MRITCSKNFLPITAALLLLSAYQAVADSSAAHPAKSWLDSAVSEKQCPSTPVNVPAGDMQFSTSDLLSRITIGGGKLSVKGTDDPDHIVVSSAGTKGFVNIAWNGKPLGRFGPVKEIEIQGHGGDDVLIVKSDVTLPVVLDGGFGDDCLQGGSGGDQLFGGPGDDVLIAGTGRPALDTGPGNDRIVVPHTMGTLRYAPTADSGVLRLLGAIYDLAPLSTSGSSSKEAMSPIIMGSADLGAEEVVSQLQAVRAAAQSVVVTNATQAQSEQLRLLLHHPNSAQGQKGATSGLGAGGAAPLIYYRTAPRPGTKANDYSTGFFITLSAMDVGTIESVSRIFSATAIVPRDPGDSASNDLTTLADSYTVTAENSNSAGSQVQITDTVFDVRSFLNSSDFYYVEQEADYRVGGSQEGGIWENMADSQIYSMQPTELQTTPSSTGCTTSTTSGVTWSVGGSAGWNYEQIANATISGGVSVNNSKTISCPNIQIVNKSNLATGLTQWTYSLLNQGAEKISFYNQWIWEIPFTTSYPAGQTTISMGSEGTASFLGPDCGTSSPCAVVTTGITPVVPIPFGDATSLQLPVVSSVTPACVEVGGTFDILGTAFYPSLLNSVVIGGTHLSSSNYSVTSDNGVAEIRVIAPDQQAYDPQSVAVHTGVGISNSNVSIEIPYLYCSDSDAGGKKK
jgi:hypothetical protein